MAKTNTERSKALRKKRAPIGMSRHEHAYDKKDHKKVVDFVKELNEKQKFTPER